MIAAILIFLAWGSYLNSLGHRLLDLEHFFKIRSFCPTCYQQIKWYDNIPLVSWFMLHGKCRSCKNSISWLYPFIEFISTFALFLLWRNIPAYYFSVYFIFFSALIISIRTDLDQMLISRFATTYLIPFVFFSAYTHVLPISLLQSVLGALCGYSLLWIAQKVHLMVTKQHGLGQGDLELLAFIGAFTSPFGCWIALSVGSLLGTIITCIYMALTKTTVTKIPFGAYLALGAIIFTLYENYFITYFFLI